MRADYTVKSAYNAKRTTVVKNWMAFC